MGFLRQVPIDTPVAVVVPGVIAFAAGCAVWRAKMGAYRVVSGLAVVVAVLVAGLAVVNVRTGTYQTVGSLIGGPLQLEAHAEALGRPPAPGPLPGHGSLVSVDIPAADGGFRPRSAWVYLPPAWFGVGRGSLPVVELLHGTPGSPSDWVRKGQAQLTAERYASQHDRVAPVLIMPDINGAQTADSGCVDGRLGNIDTYLSTEVPRWAVRTLGVSGDRSRWVVGGLSEGGTCSVNLALRHPDRYAAFLAFSAADHIARPGELTALFTGTPAEVAKAAQGYDPSSLLTQVSATPPMRGWFEVGSDDGSTTKETEAMAGLAHQTLTDAKLVVVRGAGHEWPLWTQAFDDALPWLMSAM